MRVIIEPDDFPPHEPDLYHCTVISLRESSPEAPLSLPHPPAFTEIYHTMRHHTAPTTPHHILPHHVTPHTKPRITILLHTTSCRTKSYH